MFYDIVFFLSPAAVAAGAKVSLVAGKYVITKAPATTIQAVNGGLPPADQSVQVTALIAQVAGLNGQVATLTADLATCQAALTDCLNGPPPPPPPAQTIDSFTATPNPVTAGQPVTVAWATSNATTIMLDGVAVVGASGSLVSTPSADQTFTLVATGSAAPITSTVRVVVQAAAPPPTTVTPTLEPINTSKVLAFKGYYFGGRYDRFQTATTIPTTGGSVGMFTQDIARGGVALALGAVTVTITLTPIEGGGAPVVLSPVTPSAPANNFDVVIPGTLAAGWYKASATNTGGWSTPSWPIYVAVAGNPMPTQVPIAMATYDLMHPGTGVDPYQAPYISNHVWAVVPATFTPTVQPLPDRVCPQFSTIPSRKTLVETRLAVARTFDNYRPNKMASTWADDSGGMHARFPGCEGVMTSFNRQPYAYSDIVSPVERQPALDGPRGIGNVTAAQHLMVAPMEIGIVTDPMAYFGVYFTEGVRMGHVWPDGTVQTLVGHRHKTVPTLWTDRPQDTELVGDWSGVTGAKGLNEVWGIAFDLRSLALDPDAPPISGLQPHLIGPTWYLPDRLSDGGRILKCVADPKSHATPAKVFDYLTLLQPWECVTDEANVLYVSEWGANRIVAFDMDTKAIVAQWPAASPEGLYYQDGWLYYGSLAMREIRKRNIATGQDVLACVPPIDNNSLFVKFCVGDGSWGPRGMIAVCTWSNTQYGYPSLFRPDGTRVPDNVYPFGSAPIPGLPWIASGYPTAVAIGRGRMVCSTVNEGLLMQSQALPTDLAPTPAYFAGEKEWHVKGYDQTNGQAGFGFYGLAQRWGESANMDAYLTMHSHMVVSQFEIQNPTVRSILSPWQ